MKKVLYSYFVKAIAVILFIACIVFAVITTVQSLAALYRGNDEIYSFEASFEDSHYFNNTLSEMESVLYNAYLESANLDSETVYSPEDGKYYWTDNLQFSEIVAFKLAEKLQHNADIKKLDYYVLWNNQKVFTNCGATSAADLEDNPFYFRVDRYSNGYVSRWGKARSCNYLLDGMELVFYRYENSPAPVVIAASIKQEYADAFKQEWEAQAYSVSQILEKALICISVSLLLLCYLVIVCGKNRYGELKSSWFDRVYLEIQGAIVVAAGFFGVIASFRLAMEYISGNFPSISLWGIGLCVATVSGLLLSLILSVVRNLKNQRFLKSLLAFQFIFAVGKLLLKALNWLFRRCKSFARQIGFGLSKKYSTVMITLLFAYTFLIAVCSVFLWRSRVWFYLVVFLFGFAAWFLAYRTKELAQLKDGIHQIREGDLSYRVPELKSEDLKIAAENLNEISKGMDASLAAKLRAERMKTELITNVSHDLKTPITSIINYSELLQKVDNMPEEGLDYANIISQKAERLKKLTQDLFDISKAQSGNEQIVPEKLNIALLTNQSLGENDGEIQNSQLNFCVNLPKEVYIYADGRKMSRVIGNLLNNILKYAMKQTRVFIRVVENDGEVMMEFKNISAYPMDFDAQEIVGRFVRGEESRTAEGNGLGLAIVKSYTELCGGRFEVVTDGDMFKALLYFPVYSEADKSDEK